MARGRSGEIRIFPRIGGLAIFAAWSVLASSVYAAGPAAKLAEPLPGSVYEAPASVVFDTAVDDPEAQISSVAFFSGATRLAEIDAPPYRYVWRNVPAGRYAIKVTTTATAGGTAQARPVVIVVKPKPGALSQEQAARFLQQATFGPNLSEIARLQKVGIDAWLNVQFALPLGRSHLAYVRTVPRRKASSNQVMESFWQQAVTGKDQLRQRMAFALSQIFVISDVAAVLDVVPDLTAAYLDLLKRNAFGNFRQLLEAVTLNPAMGFYLNLILSEGDPATGRLPNENYPRELLQLFSIGLTQLNLDGTPIIDGDGKPLPSYGQAEVQGIAQALSGWGAGSGDTTDYGSFYFYDFQRSDPALPMQPWPSHHAGGSKLLLDGFRTAPDQTPEQDLKSVLDNVFNHPNVGPFISRQLIQRLVTSNPSPAYVARIAGIFNDNGSGVRGDLAAVLRGILTDPEARRPESHAPEYFGKLREPVVRLAGLLRAFNARAASGKFQIWNLESAEDLNQNPLRSPTVFNFFTPDYAPQGLLAQSGLVAPEFQITTSSTVLAQSNFFQYVMEDGYGNQRNRIKPDYGDDWQRLAKAPSQLVDTLDLLFTGRRLGETLREALAAAVKAIPPESLRERVVRAVQLIQNTPDFVIQK